MRVAPPTLKHLNSNYMVNKVLLIGRVGSNPDTSMLTDGTKVSRISLATSESYTDKSGQKIENTEWHSVTLWRGLAEIAEKYLKKGDLVFVGGKLHYSSYDKDGQRHSRTEVVADTLRMLGGKKREENTPELIESNLQVYNDIPF